MLFHSIKAPTLTKNLLNHNIAHLLKPVKSMCVFWQERRHVEEMQSKEVLNDSNDAQDIDGMSEIPEEEQW